MENENAVLENLAEISVRQASAEAKKEASSLSLKLRGED